MKAYAHENIYTRMFIADLFIIPQTRHNSNVHQKSEYTTNSGIYSYQWYILTLECYSTIKWNKPLTHTTAWMDLTNIMHVEEANAKYKLYDYIHLNF